MREFLGEDNNYESLDELITVIKVEINTFI